MLTKYQKYKDYYKKYYREHKDFVKSIRDRWTDKKRFGGLVEMILKRDGYRCQRCGMTNEDHLVRWHKRLTINHINGKGRYSNTPDNNPNNLVTLCLSCHASVDNLRVWKNKSYSERLIWTRNGRIASGKRLSRNLLTLNEKTCKFA